MKRCINYYEKKSFLNFFFADLKFYYKKRWGIYILKHSPVIFLKKFAPFVAAFEIHNRITDTILDLVGLDYVDITLEDYVLIKYTDGTSRKLYVTFTCYGDYQLVEND